MGVKNTSKNTNFRVALSGSNQSVASETNARVNFNSIVRDGLNEWNNTDKRWVCSKSGRYSISAKVQILSLGADKAGILYLYKNGTSEYVNRESRVTPVATNFLIPVQVIVDLVAGDYIQVNLENADTSSRDINGGDVNSNFLEVVGLS